MPRGKRDLSHVLEQLGTQRTQATQKRGRTATKVGRKLLSGHKNTTEKKLSWVYDVSNTTAGAGAPYQAVYRANSIYDPDPAVGGTTAYGHTFLATQYQKYYVKKCKATVTAGYNYTGCELRCYQWFDNKSTVVGGAPSANTLAGICLSNGGKISSVHHVLGGVSQISHSVTTRSIFKDGYQDKDNQSVMAGNPTNVVYYHVAFLPVGIDIGAGSGFNVGIMLEYDTVCFDPVDEVS